MSNNFTEGRPEMILYMKAAEGATFLGCKVEDMSRRELYAMIGWTLHRIAFLEAPRKAGKVRMPLSPN